MYFNLQWTKDRESPYLKCVVSIWALPVREGGGGQRLARMVWGTFFPHLPGGIRACQDELGHFFSTFARLTEQGGSKAIWAMPI